MGAGQRPPRPCGKELQVEPALPLPLSRRWGGWSMSWCCAWTRRRATSTCPSGERGRGSAHASVRASERLSMRPCGHAGMHARVGIRMGACIRVQCCMHHAACGSAARSSSGALCHGSLLNSSSRHCRGRHGACSIERAQMQAPTRMHACPHGRTLARPHFTSHTRFPRTRTLCTQAREPRGCRAV